MNILALIVVGTFALSLVVSYPMMSLAQQQPEAGQQSQEQIDVPLNFSLKVKGGENAKDKNATEGGKDVTVTLKLRNSQNASPMDLPLTAKVSNDTKLQDIELCGAMTKGKEMCQSLEQFVSEKGQNQSSGASSKESSEGSSNSTDKNKDSEDN